MTRLRLDADDPDRFLGALRPGADIDAQGVEITSVLMDGIEGVLSDEDGLWRFGSVNFRGATFLDDVDITGAKFTGRADFSSATFRGGLLLNDVDVKGMLTLREAKIAGTLEINGLIDTIDLVGATVEGDLTIRVAAGQIVARALRSHERVNIGTRGARIRLTNAVCSGPVGVYDIRSPLFGSTEERIFNGPAPRTSLDSLRGFDADHLTLTDIDLSRCLFAGMRGIDRINLDGDVVFATAPRNRRWVLAEEHHWRASHPDAHRGWTRAPDELSKVGPERLEVLYRQLRKATEEAKNEPGAADFYYGEMEMRRLGTKHAGERVLLWLYWIASGYGLTARRSLGWFGAVAALCITLLALFGFPSTTNSQQARGTLTTAAGTQTITVDLPQTTPITTASARTENAIETTLNAVVFRGADTQLTTPGRYVDIVARILGPLLLGLTALAVRNQVKR